MSEEVIKVEAMMLLPGDRVMLSVGEDESRPVVISEVVSTRDGWAVLNGDDDLDGTGVSVRIPKHRMLELI